MGSPWRIAQPQRNPKLETTGNVWVLELRDGKAMVWERVQRRSLILRKGVEMMTPTCLATGTTSSTDICKISHQGVGRTNSSHVGLLQFPCCPHFISDGEPAGFNMPAYMHRVISRASMLEESSFAHAVGACGPALEAIYSSHFTVTPSSGTLTTRQAGSTANQSSLSPNRSRCCPDSTASRRRLMGQAKFASDSETA